MSKVQGPTTLKGTSNNQGWLHPQSARTCAVLSYRLFICNQNGNQENGYNGSCYAGVEVESKLESESIFSGRSRCQSCLKFVNSAALGVTAVKLIPGPLHRPAAGVLTPEGRRASVARQPADGDDVSAAAPQPDGRLSPADTR